MTKARELEECQNLLMRMVEQFCEATVRNSMCIPYYTHMFMSAAEDTFEYLVNHGLAEWSDNGDDICKLKIARAK